MTTSRTNLTDSQRRMYALEKEDNFRWIYKLLASRFPHPLTSSALSHPDILYQLASIGQFAELAHGSLSPSFIWENLDALMQPSYPLEEYTDLSGSVLLETFLGDVAKLQGYIAYKPSQRQLILAFSGTSSLAQTLRELDARLVPHPYFQRTAQGVSTSTTKSNPSVHAGFWRLYSGLGSKAMDALRKALISPNRIVDEVVITGHSLGGVISSFFLLDLLTLDQSSSTSQWWKPQQLTIKLATFGAPRMGDSSFAQAFSVIVEKFKSAYGRDRLTEYAVRGFNDGVPCLPPSFFGYVHLQQTTLYLHHGRTYNLPQSALEYTRFDVNEDERNMTSAAPVNPLGGHNYYNNRDMEKLLRRIRWMDVFTHGNTGWKERYLTQLGRETQSP